TVAPSLVTVTSPRLSTSILSIPRGPRVVLTTSETILAALILLLWASFPRLRLEPSFRIKTCWLARYDIYSKHSERVTGGGANKNLISRLGEFQGYSFCMRLT